MWPPERAQESDSRISDALENMLIMVRTVMGSWAEKGTMASARDVCGLALVMVLGGVWICGRVNSVGLRLVR